MPRPADSSIIYCIKCRKVMNGKGYYGAECQCDRPVSGKPVLSHSIGTRRS
jgi:hypothetical protein